MKSEEKKNEDEDEANGYDIRNNKVKNIAFIIIRKIDWVLIRFTMINIICLRERTYIIYTDIIIIMKRLGILISFRHKI